MDINVAHFIPHTPWSLEQSQNQDLRDALHSRSLAAHDVDGLMETQKDRIFNKVISESVPEIAHQIQRLSQGSQYLSRYLEPFLRIITATQGAATYNLLQKEFISLHDPQGHPVENAFCLIRIALMDLKAAFDQGRRPKREDWAILGDMLDGIQGTWPEQTSSWRHILQTQRNRSGVVTVLSEWDRHSLTQIRPIVDVTNLIVETVLRASERAFAIYVRKATQRLTSKCHFCQKTNPLSTQAPFVQTLSKCARCRSTFYCGLECQRRDWLKHKLTCKPKK
jgi:hypothetical protein